MVLNDWWGLLMALAVIVVPMWLAWVLLAWSDRKKGQRSGTKTHHPR